MFIELYHHILFSIMNKNLHWSTTNYSECLISHGVSDSSVIVPLLLVSSHLFQLPHQSDLGVSAGKRSAGGSGRQREAEPDEAGGIH